MHKHFVRSENIFQLSSEVDRVDKLPPGNYTVRQNPFNKEYYLEAVDPFVIPKKIYGEYDELATRILETFNKRKCNTGVLFTGEKGSGKTLTSKLISHKAKEMGIPTLLINEPHTGETFNQFLQDISQECVIIFDEFEKVYSYGAQTALLTVLDGVFPSSKLFLLTSNDYSSIDHHLNNRPGRIYYRKEFKHVSQEFITEYCEDNLKDKTQVTEVKKVASIVSKFNFDMLSSLVEEMNRYGENAFDAVKLLNISIERDEKYDITLEIGTKTVSEDEFYPSMLHSNPLIADIITINDEREDEQKQIQFTREDLVSMHAQSGTFVFVNKNKKAKITLKKRVNKSFSFSDPYYNTIPTYEN